ncbi:MAG: formylglycine-generating enzyme family protein [Chromatiales bacterium]|nr:formylglycine-generating enzyme family protein [Chromatiales bacterium]
MNKHEVTNAQYPDASTPPTTAAAHETQPAQRDPISRWCASSWQSRRSAYADLACPGQNRVCGFACRTEAEWEYAAQCRRDRYPAGWGDDPNQACRLRQHLRRNRARGPSRSTGPTTPARMARSWLAPVGRYAANAFGLADMLGNAGWTCSGHCYAAYAGGGPGARTGDAAAECVTPECCAAAPGPIIRVWCGLPIGSQPRRSIVNSIWDFAWCWNHERARDGGGADMESPIDVWRDAAGAGVLPAGRGGSAVANPPER